MNWLEGIKREDLHENYQEMIDVLCSGIKPVLDEMTAMAVVLCLSAHYPKQPFYFRSLNEVTAERKKKYIIDNFDGDNHEQLARDTDFSLTYVYEILAKDRANKQTNLFNNN